MKRSLKQGSGYLVIDHSESPGLTPSDVAGMSGAIAVGKGEKFEADVQQCSHCQRGVVLRADRVRPRGYCPKCDHYICDGCEAIRAQTGECVPFLKRVDQAVDRLAKSSTDAPAPTPGAVVLTDAD